MNLAETRTHSPILNKPKEKKSRKPIKKVSKVRAALNRQYMKLRAEFLAANPYCQWHILEIGHSWEYAQTADFSQFILYGKDPYPRSTEIHHRKGRGKYFLDTSTWMAVSAEGHRNIHADPATSYAKKYMLPRR